MNGNGHGLFRLLMLASIRTCSLPTAGRTLPFMRRAMRNGLLIVSWCALLVLLGTGVLLARAGGDGWAAVTSTTYRAEDGVHADSLEYRITPYRIRRLIRNELYTTSYVRGLERWRFPQAGRVWHNSLTGFFSDYLYLSGLPVSPQHPDHIAGRPGVGIGGETRVPGIQKPQRHQ